MVSLYYGWFDKRGACGMLDAVDLGLKFTDLGLVLLLEEAAFGGGMLLDFVKFFS